jgi:signal transduction histidine kinase
LLFALESAQGDSLERALQRHSAPDTTRVKILNDLAWFFRASDPARGLRYGQEALALGEKLKFKQGLVKTYSFLGVCYRNLSKYGLAAEMYLKHLLLAEELGSESEVFFALNNIGNLYLNQEDWQSALRYLLRNLPFAERKGTADQRAYAYTNLGRCYAGLQRYDSAMTYFDKALKYQQERKDTVRIVSILSEIANIHFLLKQDKNALSTHRRVLEAAASIDIDERNLPKSLAQIAIIYQRGGALDSSDKYAQLAANVALKVGRAETRANALRTLSENAAARGDFQTAYHIHQKFADVRDSLLQSKGVKELSSLQARYEVEKKQREIEILNNESRLQQTMRNILIAGFIIALGFVILIGVRYREKFRTEAIIREQNENLQAQAVEISSINELLAGANATLQSNNQTLQEKNDELAALNAEKNELMGIVSHDLKNPISAIHMYAELLHSKALGAEDAEAAIRQIGKTSDKMLDLVKNLLDVNRLESGGFAVNITPFDIAPVAESMVWQYASPADDKNIQLHFQHETSQSLALADEQALLQVLDNLVSNAVKYSPHGKNVFVRVKSGLSAVCVEVEDEGPGLSAEDQSKLFGKFARLSAQPTGGEHSTGLGLSIVKKMVEAMNGKVWCESELGKGARFIVELPAAVKQ